MYSNLKYIVWFIGILSLQSCGIILKQYQQVDPYKLETFRTEQLSQDTTSLADYSWSEIFKDSLLQIYMEQGLTQNLDVLVAQENLKIASSYIKQAKASFYPNVGSEANYSYSNSSLERFSLFPLPTDRVDVTDININGYFSWEIDVWGRLKSANKASVARYLQAESFHRLIKSQLVANIATNYYVLLSLDAKKAIIESTINNRKESLTTIGALKESGEVTEVAVKQNEAQLYTAQALLIDVENEIKIRENALSILMGQEPGEIKRTLLDQQQLPAVLNIGIPVQLLSNRPDILAAEYNLVNAFELSNVARASFYPPLSISGAAGLNSANFNNLFSVNALFANVLGNLTQPIFNQRKLRTQKEVRLSEQEIALLNYKSSILTAYREVSDGVYTFQANQKKLKVKTMESDALNKAIEYSEELLINGMANYLEVLRAKESLLLTQLEMVDIEFNKLNSTVTLYRALGGGWQ